MHDDIKKVKHGISKGLSALMKKDIKQDKKMASCKKAPKKKK